MNIAHQDTVMIQYKTDNGWKPLAGDQQLNIILLEFFYSKSDLWLRCAPESEFRSGPNSESDDHESGSNIYRRDNGIPEIAVRNDKRIVG